MNSETATPSRSCPQCGAPLGKDSPEGLCPACLLSGVLAPTEPSLEDGMPTLEAVAEAFPQLEIDSLIGRGGMGAVYKAYQPHLERWVALKVLPTALSAEQAFADRFSREARVLAKLNHPNIVTLYDFGQAGEFFFLLMEFVDGVNLRQAMQAGKFTPEQALGVVPKICEALQYAHGEGILHRDIKPDNILLDTRGNLKIADFGIAKVVGNEREGFPTGSETPSANMLTHASTSLGTPQYMAPEQMTDPITVDHRADIYSLGVVFYEMLTGELPTGKFKPPSQTSTVDDRIDDVVQRALEQERDQRQQSAEEMRTEVETIAQTPRSIPRASERRLGGGLALALVIVGLFLPLLAMVGLRFSEMNEIRDRASYLEHIHENLDRAFAKIDAQLANESDPSRIATLQQERTALELEMERAESTASQRLSQDPLHDKGGTKGAALLIIASSLALLGFGMLRGWRHLGHVRKGQAEGGAIRALIAALFLPLVLLFGGIMALILIPLNDGQWKNPAFTRSVGVSVSLLVSLLACYWVTRKTWRWAHNIERKSRGSNDGQNSRGLAIGCAVLFVIGTLLTIPFALIAYWNLGARPSPNSQPFAAPISASVSNGSESAYCVYQNDTADFILYHAGDWSTSTSSSSNHRNRTWNNDGTLLLPEKRSVHFYRHSGDPYTLRLNGNAFDLQAGRVFLIDSNASINQIKMNSPIVEDQQDLQKFIESLRVYRHDRYNAQHAAPFEGKPEILCLQWQVGDEEEPVTWAPDGRLMDRPEDLAWIKTLRLPGEQPGHSSTNGMDQQVLKLAIDHPAFDQSSRLTFDFYDKEGRKLSHSSNGGPREGSTTYRAAVGLLIPPPMIDAITLKLEASGGPWEHRPERFSGDSPDKRIRFLEFDHVTLHDPGGNEFTIEAQIVEPTQTHQLKVVAILYTGEHRDHGSSGRHHRSNGRVNSYSFGGLPIEDVEAFEFYVRPLREFTYSDLPLMPYPATNGIRVRVNRE